MPDITSLLENFPPANTEDRAALLDFARTTPLQYGQWKHFKKLFKLAEAPALSGDEVDVELLGILLGRIDAEPLPAPKPQLKALSDMPEIQKPVTLKGAGAEFTVGDRKSWDYSGFRLRVRILKEEKPGLFQRALGMVRASSAESTASRTYDFDARQAIGYERKAFLKENILAVEIKNYYRSETFSFDVSDPSFLFLVGGSPQAATWEYMKRRGRRLLRKTRTQYPTLYLALLSAMLREMKRSSLDPALNWAAMDALFRSNERWRQAGRGRGPYQQTRPRFILKEREEQAPQLWDGNLDLVRALWADENVPIQANLTSLKVLRAHQQSLPEISDALLQKFLLQGNPVLQSFASRRVAERIVSEGALPSAALLGAALIVAGSSARRAIQDSIAARLEQVDTPSTWRNELATALIDSLATQKTLRRRQVAIQFLISRLRNEIQNGALFQNLELFLQASPDIDWILQRVAVKGQTGDLNFLHDIARLPEKLQAQVLAAFARFTRPQTKR